MGDKAKILKIKTQTGDNDTGNLPELSASQYLVISISGPAEKREPDGRWSYIHEGAILTIGDDIALSCESV